MSFNATVMIIIVGSPCRKSWTITTVARLLQRCWNVVLQPKWNLSVNFYKHKIYFDFLLYGVADETDGLEKRWVWPFQWFVSRIFHTYLSVFSTFNDMFSLVGSREFCMGRKEYLVEDNERCMSVWITWMQCLFSGSTGLAVVDVVFFHLYNYVVCATANFKCRHTLATARNQEAFRRLLNSWS